MRKTISKILKDKFQTIENITKNGATIIPKKEWQFKDYKDDEKVEIHD